jgi:hypothetical protein
MSAQIAQRFAAIDRRSNGSHHVSLVYNAASNSNPNPIPLLLPQSFLPSPASPIPLPRSTAPAPTLPRRSTSSALRRTQPPSEIPATALTRRRREIPRGMRMPAPPRYPSLPVVRNRAPRALMPASRVLIFGSDPISLLQQQVVFFGWFSKFFGPAARPWLPTASRQEVSIVRFVPSLLFERTSRTSREILRNGHATVSCSDLTLLGGGRRTSALSS